MDNEPRFIVDTMLGTVARWLRILGYDTVYDRNYEDWQIIRRAELEKRIIVTRDRGLHNKAIKHGLKSIILWEDSMPDRLAHIALVTGIKLSIDFNKTRCPEDNALLVKADKEKVKDKVPAGVYRVHNDFWECPRCGKVYWIGSHWKLIEKILMEARDRLMVLKSKTNI
ncbi:MAG: Mut7-C RNAse domain-containing protein [Desulfurococcaceae archaeon]